MKHILIISGGKIDEQFSCLWIKKQKPDAVIAADAGIQFLYRHQMKPDAVIGDFDSADKEIVEFYRKHPNVLLKKLNPIKDDTDTEAAIRLAIELGAEGITLLGGTGTRLDHVFGNVELLGIGMEANVPITILDAHNRIRMTSCGMTIKREEQFGKYVSLLPYTHEVEHLYLKGFKYPLSDYCLKGFCSIGVSNEILEEEAFIEFEKGILLVIESRD